MIGGAPIASRMIADRRPAVFSPISIFLSEQISVVDSLDPPAVTVNLSAEVLSVSDTLSPPSVSAIFVEVIKLKDYLIMLLNGELVDGWRRTDRSTDDNWRRADRP